VRGHGFDYQRLPVLLFCLHFAPERFQLLKYCPVLSSFVGFAIAHLHLSVSPLFGCVVLERGGFGSAAAE
jgi:hypothetical protein